jgi:hypothetical protein
MAHAEAVTNLLTWFDTVRGPQARLVERAAHLFTRIGVAWNVSVVTSRNMIELFEASRYAVKCEWFAPDVTVTIRNVDDEDVMYYVEVCDDGRLLTELLTDDVEKVVELCAPLTTKQKSVL